MVKQKGFDKKKNLFYLHAKGIDSPLNIFLLYSLSSLKVLKFFFKKIFYSIPVVIGVTFLVFLLFNIFSGDPALVILGKYATKQQILEMRHELGLDKPLLIQYLDLLKTTIQFNFGRSWKSKQLISTMLSEGALNSMTITIPAFIITHVIAVSISLIVAFKRGEIFDKIVVFIAVVLMSVSVLAYILFGQWLFAYKFGWFAISGFDNSFPIIFYYIGLPIIISVVLSIGYDLRYYRTIIIDELSQDYVRTAKAKGLTNKVILFIHVLKNCLVPITANAMSQLPSLIMGAILVESFFSIPGIGSITIFAIENADFPVIKAVTIVTSIACILCNTLADIIYTILDPRIKM